MAEILFASEESQQYYIFNEKDFRASPLRTEVSKTLSATRLSGLKRNYIHRPNLVIYAYRPPFQDVRAVSFSRDTTLDNVTYDNVRPYK